jgi:hypothetical protein
MNQNYNRVAVVAVLALIATVAWSAVASNYVSPGKTITLSWSVDSPVPGEAVLKCATKATGGIVGVALSGTDTAAENVIRAGASSTCRLEVHNLISIRPAYALPSTPPPRPSATSIPGSFSGRPWKPRPLPPRLSTTRPSTSNSSSRPTSDPLSPRLGGSTPGAPPHRGTA